MRKVYKECDRNRGHHTLPRRPIEMILLSATSTALLVLLACSFYSQNVDAAIAKNDSLDVLQRSIDCLNRFGTEAWHLRQYISWNKYDANEREELYQAFATIQGDAAFLTDILPLISDDLCRFLLAFIDVLNAEKKVHEAHNNLKNFKKYQLESNYGSHLFESMKSVKLKRDELDEILKELLCIGDNLNGESKKAYESRLDEIKSNMDELLRAFSYSTEVTNEKILE